MAQILDDHVTFPPADAEPKGILECAETADADFIVTGDKRHILPLRRHGRCAIVSPRELADAIGLV